MGSIGEGLSRRETTTRCERGGRPPAECTVDYRDSADKESVRAPDAAWRSPKTAVLTRIPARRARPLPGVSNQCVATQLRRAGARAAALRQKNGRAHTQPAASRAPRDAASPPSSPGAGPNPPAQRGRVRGDRGPPIARRPDRVSSRHLLRLNLSTHIHSPLPEVIPQGGPPGVEVTDAARAATPGQGAEPT
mgnify:CR=1 FL=1